MKILIVDDEPDAIVVLRLMLKKYTNIEIVGEAESVLSATALIYDHNPDLVLLDIEMPGNSGFEIFNVFPNPSFQTVFVTAFDQFAIKAFRYNCVDYLLKPINRLELDRVIDKVKRNLDLSKSKENILSTNDLKKNNHPKILLGTAEGLHIVDMNDIIMIQAEGSYAKIHLRNQDSIFVSKNLKEMENLLDSRNFYRSHQSFLINLHFVKKVLKKDGGTIALEEGLEALLARRKKDDLLVSLNNYL